MIQIEATNDKKLLNNLANNIFEADYTKDVGFVLYYNTIPIGLAELNIEYKKSTINKVGILKSERGKGFGDFLTRSIMLRLSEISEKIEINYFSEYYTKFGFTLSENNIMTILSEKLVFPKKCQNK